VNLIDVLPTLADLLAVEDPVRRMGRSLVPAMLGDESSGLSYSEWFGLRAGRHARDQRALVYGDHKLIQRPYQKTWELYDVVADPGERNNLVGKGLDEEARLLSLMTEMDGRIDSYHRGGAAVVGPSPKEKFLTELESVVARLERADKSADVALLGRLKKLLWNVYFDATLDAQEYLGADGIKAALDRVMARFEQLPVGTRTRLLLYLGYARNGTYVEQYRKVLKGPSAHRRLIAAMALARAGHDDGADVLRAALADDRVANQQMIANAAAAIGMAESREWMRINAFDTMRPFRIPALREIDRVPGEVPGARVIRELYASQRYRSPEGNLATIAGLANARDPDALLLLARLMLDSSDDVRDAARAALLGRMSEEDVAKNRAAMSDELEADLSVINMHYEPAVRYYEQSLAKGTLWNSWVRVRMARAQHCAGDVEGARATLQTVLDESDVPADRRLARRRLDQLDSPATLRKFSCEIDPAGVRLPRRFPPTNAFRVRVPIKNTTDQDWAGGLWRRGLWFEIQFESADGEPLKGRAYENWLPEGGINAGETVTLDLVGIAPARAVNARMVIKLHQEQIHVPDDGRIYVHPTPVTIK